MGRHRRGSARYWGHGYWRVPQTGVPARSLTTLAELAMRSADFARPRHFISAAVRADTYGWLKNVANRARHARRLPPALLPPLLDASAQTQVWSATLTAGRSSIAETSRLPSASSPSLWMGSGVPAGVPSSAASMSIPCPVPSGISVPMRWRLWACVPSGRMPPSKPFQGGKALRGGAKHGGSNERTGGGALR